MFYRVSNEIYFSYGSFKVRIDDNIQIKLSRHPKLAFLNKLVIADGENEILRLVYLPKRNPFKSFDTTMGQEDHELDLITLVFYVMTNEKIKMRFKQTGYY
ncbi:MAG: hypothetical protein ING84_07550 [Cytophagales bacterium]|nr:hypothetical protein [Cytophagales bacterium]MCA6366212.1 hypothetical protein [Cytophagales bacterium]MCA6375907.1 hypothetical protein [Cytophagales bacterium]MCA6385505.1 hypothetical protein [Cytophagales bacterium]